MGTTQRSMTEASQQASAADMDFAASAKDHGPKFAFKPTPSKFTGFDDKSIKDKWLQWDMQGHFQAMKFAFDAPFAEFEKDRFLTEFFNDPNVQQTLQVVHSGLAGGGKVNWGSIGAVQAVQSKKLTTNILSLDFFDRFGDAGITRGEGHIQGCVEEPYRDTIIHHRIQECMLVEDSEDYSIFDDAERGEFIFHIFKRLVLGGGLNQWDDKTEPYLTATKLLYKDLVHVAKDPKTKKIGVDSLVYEITDTTPGGMGGRLWGEDRTNNFCYLSIDSKKHTVSVWYHAALAQW